MGDAGEIIFGPVGRVLLEIAQLLLLIFVMASHILTGTILLSTISKSAVCGIVFGVVSLIICFIGALPRTMSRVYWLSTICKFDQATLSKHSNPSFSLRKYHYHHISDHDQYWGAVRGSR